MQRDVSAQEVVKTVKELCMEANFNLGDDVLRAFDQAIEMEESETAKEVLRELKENARIAREESGRDFNRCHPPAMVEAWGSPAGRGIRKHLKLQELQFD